MSRVRVLYSFPHRIGASRICTTAWHQVAALSAAGAEVIAMPASIVRPLPSAVRAAPTLAVGGWRLPFRVIGSHRAFRLHDWIVSRRLESLEGQVDIVHAWPLGALRTLDVAARMGIPTVLERPNAHTRYAYEVVRAECRRLGMALPRGHEHAFDDAVLEREEREYARATALLCPSDFVARTFIDRGFDPAVLRRHQYGFDPEVYFPSPAPRHARPGLEAIFVGGCAPRKGLHFALEAWLASPASSCGRLRIVGAFVPQYADRLASMLAHPGIEVLGHREDVAQLMRESDVLMLPSIEEGSALVTSEARGSGCVILVSDAAGAVCEHLHDGLVHRAGDVAELTRHLSMLHADRALMRQLREGSLRGRDALTWSAAGRRLLEAYRQTIAAHVHRAAGSDITGSAGQGRPTAAAEPPRARSPAGLS